MHKRRGGGVKGHYRNGYWVEPHHRRGTDVHDSLRDGTWVQLNILSQRTSCLAPCFVCEKPVYYFRDENKGFALFDELGPPWPLHVCWEELRNCRITKIERAFRNALNSTQTFDGSGPDKAKNQDKEWSWWQIVLIFLLIKIVLVLFSNKI
jgi:hypothetical protein